MIGGGPAILDDARVMLLLCTSVAAPRGEAARPLVPAAWSRVAGLLAARSMRPASLLGMRPDAIAGALDVTGEEAGRIATMLARSGQLAFELDHLALRGIRSLTLADVGYPARLRDRLGGEAPPVLFVAGDLALLDRGGVAFLGSRDADPASLAFAESLAVACARDARVVVSGAARGVGLAAMRAALADGGIAVALPGEGIALRSRDVVTRAALVAGRAALASPYHPSAPPSVAAALGRTRLVYALADVAVVVASGAGSGETWTGAVAALNGGPVPVFVRREAGAPAGNGLLLERGAHPLDAPAVPPIEPAVAGSKVEQGSLRLVD